MTKRICIDYMSEILLMEILLRRDFHHNILFENLRPAFFCLPPTNQWLRLVFRVCKNITAVETDDWCTYVGLYN